MFCLQTLPYIQTYHSTFPPGDFDETNISDFEFHYSTYQQLKLKMEDERWLIMAVLAHLNQASNNKNLNKESLQEAIFALSNAYSLNIHNAATRERYPLNDLSLIEIFKAGRQQLQNSSSIPDTTNPPGFEKFVQKLKETTSIFEGITPSSSEYYQRLEWARQRYISKLALKQQSDNKQSITSTKSLNVEDKQIAENFKQEGNTALKSNNFQQALDLYNKAIEIDTNNPIYFSNRAAAHMRLSDFESAIDDCEKAISLDESFMRPRERLASAYRSLGKTNEEISTLENAVAINSENEALQRQLQQAKGRLNNVSNEPRQTDPLGGLGSLLGGGGGGGGAPNMNALSQMAQSMGLNLPPGAMEQFMNPNTAAQIGNMIRDNPQLMQMGMQAMMGAGRGNNTNQGNGNANGNR